MHVISYSVSSYEIPYFQSENRFNHTFEFIEESLNARSIEKIKKADAICCFVTDTLDCFVLERLKQRNIKLIALRSAGFDHVDVKSAHELGLTVVRVPDYSPQAVAEFAVALMLALTRKIMRAHTRIRQYNFSLEGQVGMNIYGKTIGIIGTGRIGSVFARILAGFDCTLLAYDLIENDACKALGVTYVTKEVLLQTSDIISLHCPLTAQTQYIINEKELSMMKEGVILINTGRGALINTQALIHALINKKIGALGLDVYEHENNLFFADRSDDIILDEQFVRLQSFSNVLLTGHQAFLTKEAIQNIISTTLENISFFEKGIVKNFV